MSAILINIYRSSIKDEMYLYVARADMLEKVPVQLLDLFGKPVLVTTMLLAAGKKMARAKAEDVINSIHEKGYYLQLPPPMPDDMRALVEKNTRLMQK